ncbi:MAG: NRDE family protein [Phycisphaerales bacterium]|nr:NRDE family protein [Phycisphaerales bacterium]
MCTVTIIRVSPVSASDSPWLRIACNRDELRTRPLAFPPETRRFGAYHALMPIDPGSGGTWIAANDAGLTLALLNVNPHIRSNSREDAAQFGHAAVHCGKALDERSAPLPGAPAAAWTRRRHSRSRGEIIPMLLACADAENAAARALEFSATDFPPFRLVMADERTVAAIYSDGLTLRADPLVAHRADRAVMFTSSGLGDALVEPPRRALFDEMFSGKGDLSRTQDEFHRHVWADRPHLSVCMRRDDARTVSHTLVEVHPHWILMRYHADAPDIAACDTKLQLARGAGR